MNHCKARSSRLGVSVQHTANNTRYGYMYVPQVLALELKKKSIVDYNLPVCITRARVISFPVGDVVIVMCIRHVFSPKSERGDEPFTSALFILIHLTLIPRNVSPQWECSLRGANQR